jgi:type II secretory ATPase GspE/PulE/Tfp pilus assembly ATPase PilB-like protein
MNCDLAKTEMIAYLREELDARQRQAIEEHLASCAVCRKELEAARNVLSWTAAASDAKVVEAVEALMRDAVAAGASDAHLEMQGDGTLLVRQRIDGVLHEVQRFDPAMADGIIARIKTLADMNVGETRLPQDGRIARRDDGSVDVRVACCPFAHGSSIVMRFLNRDNVLLGLDRLEMGDDTRAAVDGLIHRPNGLIIVTGPVGSGRTTTMYSMLQAVIQPHIKVVTIEDPVEYLIPGANQGRVNRAAGHTFATALRAYMRHDPDIVMVGEIRDLETAELCMHAALTGHIVITSMIVRDAQGVPQRLASMGIEPFMTSGALIGVVAQRLVRRICDACKREVPTGEHAPMLAWLGLGTDDVAGRTLWEGAGCEKCRRTGYRGRTALFEVLTIDRDLSTAIGAGAPPDELARIADRAGFRAMRQDGLRKVLAGITTAQEVVRVLA